VKYIKTSIYYFKWRNWIQYYKTCYSLLALEFKLSAVYCFDYCKIYCSNRISWCCNLDGISCMFKKS